MIGVSRREALAARAGAITFAVIFCWRILANLKVAGVAYDWDVWLSTLWVARHSIIRFHQLPLWNPYECGGIPLLADPQSHILTPFFPLTLAVGLHLELPLHLAIGWAGAYLLARTVGSGRMGGICTACAFCSSSWFFLRAGAGHVVFLPMVYLPLTVAFAWLGAKRRRIGWSIAAAALVAITFGEGGVYAASYTLLVLALLMAPLAVLDRSLWPLLSVAIVIIFAPGFAAIKLLPSLAFYDRYPRPIDSSFWANLKDLSAALFSRNQDLNRHGTAWGFWEYGAYIGLFAIPALGGLLRPKAGAPMGVRGAGAVPAGAR